MVCTISAIVIASVTIEDIYDFRPFFLTKPRRSLMETIDYRCELMIEKGLVQEVVNLLIGISIM